MVQVSFSVAKLFRVSNGRASDVESEPFAWVCVGTSGRVALFRGKKLVREWDSANARAADGTSDCLVDSALIQDPSSGEAGTSSSLAVAFPGRIEMFPLTM